MPAKWKYNLLHILLVTNLLILFVSVVHNQFGMVRLALAGSHMIIGIAFTLVYLFWQPLVAFPARSIVMVMVYWFSFLAFIVTKILITQIVALFSLISMIPFYALLYYVIRETHRHAGLRYTLRHFAEVPLFALVIYYGFMYWADPGGPFIRAFVAHLFLATIAVVYILSRPIYSLIVKRNAQPLRQLVYPAAILALIASSGALAVGTRWAKQFGEKLPEFTEIKLSIDEASKLKDLVKDPAAVIVRPGCTSGRCHADLYEQWYISPHRFSVNNVLFQRVRHDFIDEFGAKSAHFCDRCHDPVGLFVGNPSGDLSMERGINCISCHAIIKGETGNGIATYQFRNIYSYPTKNLDRATPRYQQLIFMTKAFHYLEFNYFRLPSDRRNCYPCHRVVLPEKYTRSKEMILGDTITPWSHSGSARIGAGCIACHLPNRIDREEQATARPDHIMFGTNQAVETLRFKDVAHQEDLPLLQSMFDEIWFSGNVKTADEYEKSTRNMAKVFTRGRKPAAIKGLVADDWFARSIREILGQRFDLDSFFSPAVLDIQLRAIDPPRAGGSLELAITTTNLLKAHQVPSGPLDLNQVWLELIVTDAHGTALYHVGRFDETHHLDRAAPRLGAVPVDKNGVPIEYHRFWHAAALTNKRILQIGESTVDRFLIPIPHESIGPLVVNARWLYRRYSQRIMDWAFPGEHRSVPVSVFGSAQSEFPLLETELQ